MAFRMAFLNFYSFPHSFPVLLSLSQLIRLCLHKETRSDMLSIEMSSIHASSDQRDQASRIELEHLSQIWDMHRVLPPVQVKPAKGGYMLVNGIEQLLVAERAAL